MGAELSKEFILNEMRFFELFPKRPAEAHKGQFGRILIVSGGRGMAGAAHLNISGTKALGASYVLMALPEEIYGIVAAGSMTTVYYPYVSGKGPETVRRLVKRTSSYDEKHRDITAVCFGSGAVELQDKYKIFSILTDECDCPLVLDAEALNIMSEFENSTFNKGRNRPVIITPHYGEFSILSGLSLKEITASDKSREERDEYHAGLALSYSEKHNVITVLKGPHTVVTSPDRRYYINCTGNQGLAQAGSGDVLTGMITAMCSFINDPFEAACMGVFAHGLAADELCKTHSMQCMPLEKMPETMDQLFYKHGF